MPREDVGWKVPTCTDAGNFQGLSCNMPSLYMYMYLDLKVYAHSMYAPRPRLVSMQLLPRTTFAGNRLSCNAPDCTIVPLSVMERKILTIDPNELDLCVPGITWEGV